jgi:hypothetical protein
VKRLVGYPGGVGNTHKLNYLRLRTDHLSSAGAAVRRSMNQYLPCLLIGAGILVLAAVVIYWRMSYVESD